jgi:hypothetical protein
VGQVQAGACGATDGTWGQGCRGKSWWRQRRRCMMRVRAPGGRPDRGTGLGRNIGVPIAGAWKCGGFDRSEWELFLQVLIQTSPASFGMQHLVHSRRQGISLASSESWSSQNSFSKVLIQISMTLFGMQTLVSFEGSDDHVAPTTRLLSII